MRKGTAEVDFLERKKKGAQIQSLVSCHLFLHVLQRRGETKTKKEKKTDGQDRLEDNYFNEVH